MRKHALSMPTLVSGGRRYPLPVAGLVLATMAACFAGVQCALGPLPSGGDVGVTTGGAKDMAYARQTIEDGGVPDPGAITVEGLLSEHSIEIEPPPDPGLLYTTATVAWNDDFDSLTPLVTVQVGFGTTIDTESFSRRPLNLCLVIDRSGSMADPIDQRTGTSKLDAVKVAIDRLLAQLGEDDLVSVVSFAADPSRLLDPVPGDNIIAVKSALDGIEARGATNLARGMLRGYRLVREHSTPQRSDRIFVFTDANVTAGTSDSEDFVAVMDLYADEGIGATIFGVGTDFGQELAYDISQVRGGNLFYLSDYERMVTVFDEEFDFLVTPVAYDVNLTANVPFSFDIVDAFGLPNVDTATHLLEMTVPTLFLSNREGGGAIMIRLRPGALVDFGTSIEVGSIGLSYRTTEGESVETAISVTLPSGLSSDASESYFQTPGTQRGVLLLNTALVLKNACEDVNTCYYFDDYYYCDLGSAADYDRAVARLTEFLPYFDRLAEGLEDRPSPTSRSLSQERALIDSLLENIQLRAWP